MDDNSILRMYFERSEFAVEQTSQKYGDFCHTIAYGILKNNLDAEECVNDVYLKAWESIPPAQPKNFSAFLAKITRNCALSRYRKNKALKRSGCQIGTALEELSECIDSGESVEESFDEAHALDAINRFLRKQTDAKRNVFIRRYWFFDSVEDIAQRYGMSVSAVKMSLKRTRESLKEYLEREGVQI